MLIEDTDESVRAATIKSIAINTAHIYDTDKYAQVNTKFFQFYSEQSLAFAPGK